MMGWLLGLLAAGLLGFGVAAWHAARMPPALELPRGARSVTGTVAEVTLLPEGQRVTLADAQVNGGAPLARSLRIRLRADDPARPAPGDTLSLRAQLRTPARRWPRGRGISSVRPSSRASARPAARSVLSR
jgi:competence protein ComEC